MRTDPPWSLPTVTSALPAATSAALPLDDPPVECVGRRGFRTAPVTAVFDPDDRPNASAVALPTTRAPASRTRVTTVASMSGTNPSRTPDPFVVGTPATRTLSLNATVRPWSGPS